MAEASRSTESPRSRPLGTDGGTAGEVDALIGTAATGADPGQGLRAVVALRRLADRLELLHVERARQHGWSWQAVAEALGVSRQAVHKKYGRR